MKKLLIFTSLFLLFQSITLSVNNCIVKTKLYVQPVTDQPVMKAIIVIVDDYMNADLNIVSETTKFDYGTVAKFLHVLDKRGICKVEKHILMGRYATLSDLEKEIKKIQTNENDIIFFYFSGYGDKKDQKTTQLYFRDNGEILERPKIDDLFSTKNARLKIIMTDPSNSIIDGMKAKYYSSSKSANEGKFDSIYSKLFVNHKGTLSITSCMPNEYSWSDSQMGGYFTWFLFNELMMAPKDNWEGVFSEAKRKTSELVMRMPEKKKNELNSNGKLNQTPALLSSPVYNGNKQSINNQKNSNLSITVTNSSQDQVFYIIDRNKDKNNWSKNNMLKFPLQAGKSFKFDQPTIFCLLNEKDLFYYDLNLSGNYLVNKGINGKLKLFKEGEEEPLFSDNISGYTANLIGSWIWDEIEGKYSIIFGKDKKFQMYYGKKIYKEGQWKTDVYQDMTETVVNINLNYKDKNNDNFEYSYQYRFIDVNTIQLLLGYAKKNNREVSLDFIDQGLKNVMLFNIGKN